MNVFLFGTCRIHIPFGCDYPCKYDYKAFNLFHTDRFLGPKYNIKEIIQMFHTIIGEVVIPSELLPHVFADSKIDLVHFDTQLQAIREDFMKSELVVIEISTLKTMVAIMNEIEYQINFRDFNRSSLQNVAFKKMTEEELLADLDYIQTRLVRDFHKKVLFATHYNLHHSIPSRQLIIDCCKKKANVIFDPTDIVNANYPHSLKDSWHYSRETEYLVADALHATIQSL